MNALREADGPDRVQPGALLAVGACALLLLAYTTARAILVSLSWDETYTFIHFVLPRMFFIRSFDSLSANHHLLNVWGMMVAHQLFGDDEWALRLPNLVAHAAYLYASARIALRARSTLLALAAFLLLNLHPYLLDFFSLARGYGLSLGCVMVSLWQVTRYLREGRHTKHLLGGALAAALAAMASLILLNYLLAFALGLVVLWAVRSRSHGLSFPWRQAALLIAVTVAALALLLPTALGLSKGGSLYYGCDQFWECTIGSLGGQLLYQQPYGMSALQIMGCAITTLVAGSLFCLWTVWRSGQRERLWHMAFGALVLLACLAGILLQHLLLGTLMPRTRTALFLLPLALFVLVSGLVACPPPGRAVTVLAVLFCVPLVMHQARCANFSYALEWRASGEMDHMLDLIKQDHAPLGTTRPVIAVGVGMQSWGSIPYYIMHDSLQWMVPRVRLESGAFPPCDYYFVESDEGIQVDEAHWELLYRSTATGTCLYRDKRWRAVPQVIHHEKVDMEEPDIPGRTEERHASGRYSVRFDARSRYTRTIRWPVPDTLESPDLRLLATAMITQPDQLDWITFILRVTRQGKQIAYADASSAMQMRDFGQWQKVGLPLCPAQPLWPGDTVEVEALPLTDDTVMYLDDLELWVLQ